jgi:hypothetical protein
MSTVQQALGLGGVKPSSGQLQEFFSEDAEGGFATWDSVPPDSTFTQVEGLTPGQRWYFAVTAFDEAGAYEPRFLLDHNLLQFRPSTALQAPTITVFNSFFARTQLAGGIDLSERAVVRIEAPAGIPVEFNWSATPGAQGTLISGYRWVLDPIDGDIFDETPRQSEDDVNRWSGWSLTETRALVGPFVVGTETDSLAGLFRRFYVEARDNIGSISLVSVELRIVEPSFANDLLIIDDMQANTDRPGGQPWGPYPTEAVMDTLLYAVGGMPYKDRPPGTLSDPGVFAGFDYDTLDYRFYPFEGIPLRLLAEYKAVVWYVAVKDGAQGSPKFVNTFPRAALRFHNTIGELNTLAVYLGQGGRMWLFGDGIAPAIGNGYISRFSRPSAPFPFVSTGDAASSTSILWPGNFLYDNLKVRSEMDLNSRRRQPRKEMVDLIPYLPEYRTPGAPWPATPENWIGGRGPMDDPRVGPSSVRNMVDTLCAGPDTWEGLPMLTRTTEFPDWPLPLQATEENVAYVARDNFILEDHDGTPITPKQSRLDTLYIMRADGYRLDNRPDESDGKPVVFYYWGGDHGPVAWMSLRAWWFERTQLRELARMIMSKFGLQRIEDPQQRRGPQSAHSRFPRLVEVTQ